MPSIKAEDGIVSVTGASGYVGAHVVGVLMRRGYRVRACVTDTNNSEKSKLDVSESSPSIFVFIALPKLDAKTISVSSVHGTTPTNRSFSPNFIAIFPVFLSANISICSSFATPDRIATLNSELF